MENDAEETFSPMLLEDSPPPDETKKRAWPCRLQIPIGILIVGLLVGGGVLCFLSLADSKDVERVKAGNIFHFVGDFQERNRRHLLSSGVQAPSSHTPGCTIEQATDYYGWDLEGGSKIKVTANQQECADYSASTPGSRFWTWSKTTKKCYPKSSKAGRRGAGIELVSGNNRCASSGCTIEQAKDYYGWDLEGGSKIKVTANQQECADYSASTPGSRFWTWSKTTKECYPKSLKAGRRGAGIELVSGNNRCANSGSLMTTKVKTALDGLVDAAEAAARGAAAAAAAGEDVEFSMEEIKEKGDYENLCYTCSVVLVGFQGKLQRFNTYSTGYADSVIKVTKNYSGPKIQYLNQAGLMQIHSGKIPLEEVDFNLFGVEASTHVSYTGAGYQARVKLIGGKVSVFELQLGIGVSSQIGIVDDSMAVKIFGLGGSIGRKTKICAFDNCFGIDFGNLFG